VGGCLALAHSAEGRTHTDAQMQIQAFCILTELTKINGVAGHD